MRTGWGWLLGMGIGLVTGSALEARPLRGTVDFWPGRTLQLVGEPGWAKVELDEGSGRHTILPEQTRLDSAWIVDGVLLFEVEKRRGCLRRVDSLAWRVRSEVTDSALASLCKERRPTPQGWVRLYPSLGTSTRELFRLSESESRRARGGLLDPDTAWDGPLSNQWLSFLHQEKGELHFSNRGNMQVIADGIGRVLRVDRDPGYYVHRDLELQADTAIVHHRVAVLPRAGVGIDSNTLLALGLGLESAIQKEPGFQLIERRSVAKILAEQALQKSGACGSEFCLRQAGALAGAELTLLGTFGQVGKLWVASLQLVDVSTGQVLAASNRTWATDLKTVIAKGLFESSADLARGVGARSAELPTGRVALPAGCFRMGNDKGNDDEKPVHEVCLEAFKIDRTEVTNASYDSCVATGKCSKAHYQDGSCQYWSDSADGFLQAPTDKSFQSPLKPVVCVDWEQAKTYCGFRKGKLPTEAQWEYAARAGSQALYPWGNRSDSICLWANAGDRTYEQWRGRSQGAVCSDGAIHTTRVGSYRPNAWGLYDMIGNAWEWTQDWYWEKSYSHSARHDPQGAGEGPGKATRGGCWFNDPGQSYAALRDHLEAYVTQEILGFRCVEVAP